MKGRNQFIVFIALLAFVAAIAVPSISGEKAAEILSDPITYLVALTALFLIVALLAVQSALESIKYFVAKREGKLEELEQAEAKDSAIEKWFATFWTRIQDSIPIEREAEIEMHHEYDGIRELDNNLPPWWLYGFYISIAFALVYLVRYHVTQSAPLSEGEYAMQMEEAAKQKAEYLKTAANLVDETNVVHIEEEAFIKEGAAIFQANCAVCHAADGGGGVGPNLTDAYWLHGGDIKAIFSTVKYGVPAKGMIPWKDQLNPAQMHKVSSFIVSLGGTSPLNPKDPQGEFFEMELADEVIIGGDTLEAKEVIEVEKLPTE